MYSDLEMLELIDGAIENWAGHVYKRKSIQRCELCQAFPLCENEDGQKCPVFEMTGVEDCETDEAPILMALFHEYNETNIFANHVLSFGYTVRLWWINRMNKRRVKLHKEEEMLKGYPMKTKDRKKK